MRNNEPTQRLWVSLLLAALAAPAAEVLLTFWQLWAQDPELLNDLLSSNAFLLWVRGKPLYSYVGFVGLGLPLLVILRAFGSLTFSRIVILFAFLGAVTYWLSLVYMHEYLVKDFFRITGGQPPQLRDWFGGADSVAREIFGKGVLVGVLVGTTLFSIIGRAGRQGGGAESTQHNFRTRVAVATAFTCAVTGLAVLALWEVGWTPSSVAGSYRGKATNKTSNGASDIQLILKESRTELSGRITTTGDLASSGPIRGYRDGHAVAFSSWPSAGTIILWEGTFDGSRIKGRYVLGAPISLKEDNLRPADQEGVWEVAK